jgi:hypothetical protein
MNTAFFAGLAAISLGAGPVFSDVPARPVNSYVLVASSETRSYGLWVTAPDEGCKVVRYSVRSGSTLLGRSPPLRPGDGAMIRIGHGFVVGPHVLSVTGTGCSAPPAVTRRVLLGKQSADHSWRWK